MGPKNYIGLQFSYFEELDEVRIHSILYFFHKNAFLASLFISFSQNVCDTHGDTYYKAAILENQFSKKFSNYTFQVKVPKTTLVYFSVPFDAVIGMRLATLKKIGR